VSEGGSVKLQIHQEVSNLSSSTAQAADLITNTRSIDSTVLVDDGQIIVLGGLISDLTDGGVEKVPLLGDIPVIGYLFKYEKRKRVKTNLMVFLRPYVLRDANSATALTNDRYDFIRKNQAAFPMERNLFLPDMPVGTLPEFKDLPQRSIR
jgi:general secretion pathway protein D